MKPVVAAVVVGQGASPDYIGKETIHQRFNDLGFSYSQEWAVTKKALINYCGVEWIKGGGTACSRSSGCVDLGFYIKAALFFKCFPEKAGTRANIIRAGTNSIVLFNSSSMCFNSIYNHHLAALQYSQFSVKYQMLNSILFNSNSIQSL